MITAISRFGAVSQHKLDLDALGRHHTTERRVPNGLRGCVAGQRSWLTFPAQRLPPSARAKVGEDQRAKPPSDEQPPAQDIDRLPEVAFDQSGQDQHQHSPHRDFTRATTVFAQAARCGFCDRGTARRAPREYQQHRQGKSPKSRLRRGSRATQ